MGGHADCYVQPWFFGYGETKRTGLWLKGLPPLMATCVVEGRYGRVHSIRSDPSRWKDRSRTCPGMAAAMAKQWGNYKLEVKQ